MLRGAFFVSKPKTGPCVELGGFSKRRWKHPKRGGECSTDGGQIGWVMVISG